MPCASGTAACNGTGARGKEAGDERHLDEGAQRGAFFKGACPVCRIQAQPEEKGMQNRMECAETAAGRLKSLRIDVIGKGAGELNQEHRYIACKQKRSPKRRAQWFFLSGFEPACRQNAGKQSKQYRKSDRKCAKQAQHSQRKLCGSGLIDLRAQRKEEGIYQCAEKEHAPCPCAGWKMLMKMPLHIRLLNQNVMLHYSACRRS